MYALWPRRVDQSWKRRGKSPPNLGLRHSSLTHLSLQCTCCCMKQLIHLLAETNTVNTQSPTERRREKKSPYALLLLKVCTAPVIYLSTPRWLILKTIKAFFCPYSYVHGRDLAIWLLPSWQCYVNTALSCISGMAEFFLCFSQS